jgi:tRNA A-37 threonylcarbamoyl transferase component Bud32
VNSWTPSPQLRELTQDQRERWQRGDKRLVEQYFDDHKELRSDEKLLLDFVCSEFSLRQEHGDTPTLAEYVERFPALAQQLELLFEVMQAIDSEPALQAFDPDSRILSPSVVIPPTGARRTTASRNGSQPASVSDSANGSSFRLFGPYELIGEVARGGMGIVYKARQPKLDRIVAIKTIVPQQFESDSAVRRFQVEAEAAAKLDHPGVVPIYDVGELDGEHYLCMAYVEGESLATRVARGPLAADEAARIVRDVAEAVQHAHDRGIIHRDLKPANILIDNTGRPRVTDFGLARKQDVVTSLSSDGSVIGTPAYMSPEQALGQSDNIGPLCDVYSLGAVLFHLLTGRPPFGGSNVFEIVQRVRNEAPKKLRDLDPSIPQPLETICLRCLAKDPQDRYSNAQALADDLNRYLQGSVVSPLPSPHRRVNWFTLPFAAGLVAAISLLAFCAVLLFKRPPSPSDSANSVPVAGEASSVAPVATLKPLSGELTVRVWDPRKNSLRHGQSFDSPGVLPLRYGDQIRVEAKTNRPAYLYLIWITPEGEATPIYPWTPVTPWKPEYWRSRPKEERPVDTLSLPAQAGKGWPIDSGKGFETIVLLGRDEPLPDNVPLDSLFAGLPTQEAPSQTFVWLEPGEQQVASLRGPNFSKLETIDDSTQQLKEVLSERLKPLHLSLYRAVCLSNRGS